MGQLRNWIDLAIIMLDTASGRDDDKVAQWKGSIVYNPRSFMGLREVPDRFRPLDKALASAMIVMIAKAATKKDANRTVKELQERVTADSHRAIRHGFNLRGQQILWLFLESFKTSDEMGNFYGIIDLANVTFTDDARMSQFKNQWDFYTENLGTKVSRIELRNILLRQLEKSTVLRADIAHYHRKEPGHPDKTSGYLYHCMVRYLELETQKRNRQAQTNLLQQAQGGNQWTKLGEKAAPGQTKGKGKDGKNGKKKKHNGGSGAGSSGAASGRNGDKGNGKGNGKTGKSNHPKGNPKGGGKSRAAPGVQQEPSKSQPPSNRERRLQSDIDKMKNQLKAMSAASNGQQKKLKDMTAAEKKQIPCFYWQEGKCNKSDHECEFGHRKVRTDEEKKAFQAWRARSPSTNRAAPGAGQCYAWATKGECEKGDQCKWASSHTQELKGSGRGGAKPRGRGRGRGKGKGAGRSGGK